MGYQTKISCSAPIGIPAVPKGTGHSSSSWPGTWEGDKRTPRCTSPLTGCDVIVHHLRPGLFDENASRILAGCCGGRTSFPDPIVLVSTSMISYPRLFLLRVAHWIVNPRKVLFALLRGSSSWPYDRLESLWFAACPLLWKVPRNWRCESGLTCVVQSTVPGCGPRRRVQSRRMKTSKTVLTPTARWRRTRIAPTLETRQACR